MPIHTMIHANSCMRGENPCAEPKQYWYVGRALRRPGESGARAHAAARGSSVSVRKWSTNLSRLCKCSNEQRMIALSTSLFRSPADNLTHCTETKQLRPLNNRKCRFDNGFNVVQNRRPCSLSGGTSNGTTPSSHRTFSSSGRRPVPKNNPIFPVRPGLIRPPGLTGPRLRLTSACQSGCLQSTVVAFPS